MTHVFAFIMRGPGVSGLPCSWQMECTCRCASLHHVAQRSLRGSSSSAKGHNARKTTHSQPPHHVCYNHYDYHWLGFTALAEGCKGSPGGCVTINCHWSIARSIMANRRQALPLAVPVTAFAAEIHNNAPSYYTLCPWRLWPLHGLRAN